MSHETTHRNPDHRVLGREVQRHLGTQLQDVFSDVEKGPLPDDQIELLLALRRIERQLQREQP